MSEFQLRDYQQKCKSLISQRFKIGDNRILAWLNTGAGKGLLMANFVKESIDKGMPVLSVMRRREIILQTIKNYQKYYGIKSNPIMGSIKHGKENLSTVASIDTLRNRIRNPKYEFIRDCQLVIIDEAHDLTSDSYKRLIWWLEGNNLEEFSISKFEEFKNDFKKIYIGLTATPFRVGRRTHTYWNSVIKPIESHELRDRGFLVPAKVYAPKKIDTSGLRIDPLTGDFDQKEIFERVSKLEVIGDVVETYRDYSNKFFGKLKPAILFAVNQNHSKIMTEAFRRAGIPAIHCDADHSEEERRHAIEGLKNGTYLVLCNCNIFSTGFDAPWIEIEICARPTDSEILFIQQIGRVLRPYKVCMNCHTEYGGDESCWRCGSTLISYEKEFALILDHANNTDRWGLPYDVREAELEPIDRSNSGARKHSSVKTCPKCEGVMSSIDRYCVCGFDFTGQVNHGGGDEIITHTKGELELVDNEFIRAKKYQKIKDRYNSYKRIEMLRRWNPEAKYYKLFEDFGEDFLEFACEFGCSAKLKNKMKKNELDRSIESFLNMGIKNDSKIIT